MAIEYKIVGREDPLNPENGKKYYAQVKAKGMIDFDELVKEICFKSSLKMPDVYRITITLIETVARKLQQGYAVDLFHLAFLYPSIQSEGIDDPGRFRDKHIKRIKVNIRPKKRLNDMVNRGDLKKIKD